MFEFDASRSFDPDGQIISFEWYFGDGSMILTRNKKCYYSYDIPGEFDVICVVGDNKGGYNSISRAIVVSNNAGQGGSSFENRDVITSVDSQKGLLFYSGNINKDIEELNEIEEIDSQTDSSVQQYDLSISVNYNIESAEPGESVIFSIEVEDELDNYNAGDVFIELISDIPGYTSVDYYAQLDSSLNCYYVEVDILWPEDEEQYSITFTAKPFGENKDLDWTDNRWSDMISLEYNELISTSIGTVNYSSCAL